MYLSWKANQHGLQTQFIELADQINREMPEYVIQRLTTLLNDEGVPLSQSNVLVLGAAYKPNVTDTRESPALDIIHLLVEHGTTVNYHDPLVPSVDIGGTTYESRSLTPELLAEQDCAVIITDHDALPIQSIIDHAPLVFDTRNATASMADSGHVHQL
jgi:UDP-N-acetyl-D-glucosamine dehydrogenase